MAIRTWFKICPDRGFILAHLTIIISANMSSRSKRAEISGNSRSTDVPGIPSLNPIFMYQYGNRARGGNGIHKAALFTVDERLDSPVECQILCSIPRTSRRSSRLMKSSAACFACKGVLISQGKQMAFPGAMPSSSKRAMAALPFSSFRAPR